MRIATWSSSIYWFADEIIRAAAQRCDGFVNQHIRGNHDHDRIGLAVTNLT